MASYADQRGVVCCPFLQHLSACLLQGGDLRERLGPDIGAQNRVGLHPLVGDGMEGKVWKWFHRTPFESRRFRYAWSRDMGSYCGDGWEHAWSPGPSNSSSAGASISRSGDRPSTGTTSETGSSGSAADGVGDFSETRGVAGGASTGGDGGGSCMSVIGAASIVAAVSLGGDDGGGCVAVVKAASLHCWHKK